MSTTIYPSPVFGPVHSRRLGLSLGINLMPADGKLCTFDCIYCECGFNSDRHPHAKRPSRDAVRKALEQALRRMAAEGTPPDVLTFAGNGEPTAHPDFAGIVGDVIGLRDELCPKAKVSVLSNATMAHHPDVHDALCRVDNNILKLDTVCPEYIATVNRPSCEYDVRRIVETMRSFNGKAIVQTMFMRGQFEGHDVDNTSKKYVAPWLESLRTIAPRQVMIYTVARETPARGLLKVPREVLDDIRQRVERMGIPCSAAY